MTNFSVPLSRFQGNLEQVVHLVDPGKLESGL